MNTADRARLTTELAQHTATIAAELREQMLAPGPVRTAAERLHEDEQVGDAFEVWTDLLSRRAAVLFVLKTVYVRVLEDRGAIQPLRIVDRESQTLFEKLAPNLGDTAYLRWVFRDLASPVGGLPELFAPQPAEIGTPTDATSKALLDTWRRTNPDTGVLDWRFDGERFDGALLGDLYQDLDPVVKARYALLQTPDFVREFMLDRTLTPAIEAHGADAVRVLDPACGSGHFLLEAFRRLLVATAAQHPDWSRPKLVHHVLKRVVGIDLNDYACALARARLIMLALELAGEADHTRTLADAADFHPQIFNADGLDQVELGGKPVQVGLFDGPEAPPRAALTRPETKAVLRPVLQGGFEVVVANPPYITEKDKERKAYHREKIAKVPRYVSAYREYSLASPFTERCFQLATKAGWVGLITSNNFMKREFGKKLITDVLATKDLTLVVDSSGAFIPGHGTPTVIFFGRNRKPKGKTVRAVMGKRGEPSNPEDPRQGEVWTSILGAWDRHDFENEFVSSADLPRATFHQHPWSLQGGGATTLRELIEKSCASVLSDLATHVGITAVTGEDEVFIAPDHAWVKRDQTSLRPLIVGELVRDWQIARGELCLFPYDGSLEVRPPEKCSDELRYLWTYREAISHRKRFGTPMVHKGLHWYELQELYPDKLRTPLTITFAFVATHNHFVLDRGGKVFNRSAPVIKLPATATEDDHLALLGLLNSSVACFWMKQVFHCKGIRGEGGGITSEQWEQFIEYDSTKIKPFPIPAGTPTSWARALDAAASERAANSLTAVLDAPDWSTRAELTAALQARHTADLAHLRRMVALQEELDWQCYGLYGVDTGSVLPPDEVVPLDPTCRPMALLLARKDRQIRDALARGEETFESPTAWFERHRWEPRTELPDDLPDHVRTLYEDRLTRIAANKELQLLERPEYKRRWYNPDHADEQHKALATWLTDRIEDALAKRTQPRTASQLAGQLQADARFLAAAEVYTDRTDFDLPTLVATLLKPEAVPSHPLHLYKPKGLKKRAAWEQTWADQRREDAGEDVTPKVPPKYTGADFLRPEHYRLRGKLDVPKERFIALTEVPQPADAEPLFGWAGWTPAQRLRVLLDLDESLEDNGVSEAERTGLLDTAWRLLPDVERTDPDAAARGRTELVAIVGASGPSDDAVQRWFAAHPPPKKSRSRKRK